MKVGDHLKLEFPLASTTTVVAWSLIDFPLGYSSANRIVGKAETVTCKIT